MRASVAVGTGLAAPQHVESSRTRDQTHVLHIRTQILIRCVTGEVLLRTFLRQFGHFLFHLKIT